MEGFREGLGYRFLGTYADREALRLAAGELPFEAAQVPGSEQPAAFAASDVLFHRTHDDYSTATLDFHRHAGGSTLAAHQCGRVGLQLLKVTGSSFTSFVRHDYTTLPERVDRPLFSWTARHRRDAP